MIDISIRQEGESDFKEVENLVFKSFENSEHTDGNEHNLVKKLRKSDNFIKELSLVALKDNKIIGHIMSTRLDIKSNDKTYISLALAPISVHPEFQKMGVGGKLIKETLKIAKDLGYESIFLLGSDLYYPKFGFKKSIEFGINPPFDFPSNNFMAIELTNNTLKDVDGSFIYAKEFFE